MGETDLQDIPNNVKFKIVTFNRPDISLQTDKTQLNANYLNRQFKILTLPVLLEQIFNYKDFKTILNNSQPIILFYGNKKEEWKSNATLQLSNAGRNMD